ncbi:MAG: hypothetical protein ACP5NZ_03000 [Nanobdellota archaeon]
MDYKNSNYEVRKMSSEYNLSNYRNMYNHISSGEKSYMNCIKYVPNTTRTGNYIHSN